VFGLLTCRSNAVSLVCSLRGASAILTWRQCLGMFCSVGCFCQAGDYNLAAEGSFFSASRFSLIGCGSALVCILTGNALQSRLGVDRRFP
jgi:hypothetical protein